MKILTYFFGNKVKIVTARNLRSYMEFEQQFLFNGFEDDETIRKFLWNHKDYSIKEIKKLRSKKISSPPKNNWREFTNEKVVKFYD